MIHQTNLCAQQNKTNRRNDVMLAEMEAFVSGDWRLTPSWGIEIERGETSRTMFETCSWRISLATFNVKWSPWSTSILAPSADYLPPKSKSQIQHCPLLYHTPLTSLEHETNKCYMISLLYYRRWWYLARYRTDNDETTRHHAELLNGIIVYYLKNPTLHCISSSYIL